MRHSPELNALFRTRFAEHDLDETLAAFRQAGGTIAPVLAIDQNFGDPQIQAREAIVPVSDDDFGQVRIQSVVPRFTKRPQAHSHTARALGQYTDAVMARIGLGAEQVQALRQAGII